MTAFLRTELRCHSLFAKSVIAGEFGKIDSIATLPATDIAMEVDGARYLTLDFNRRFGHDESCLSRESGLGEFKPQIFAFFATAPRHDELMPRDE